jgi:exopolysaccharide biosynthesis polyprenyl glycosylphosphotransferase
MLRRKERLFAQLMLLCDMAALLASYAAAYWLRNALSRYDYNGLPPIEDELWLFAIIIPVSYFSLYRVGLYQSKCYESRRVITKSVVKAQIIAGLILLSAMYLGKRIEISRLFLQIFLAASTVCLIGGKLGARTLLMRRVQRSRVRKRWRVAVVGDESHAERYMCLLREHPFWAIEVVAVIPTVRLCDMRREVCDGLAAQPKESHWSEVLSQYLVDEVVAVSAWEDAPEFTGLADACRYRGLTFRILIDMPATPVGTYRVDDLGAGSYLVSLETIPQDYILLLVKRGIDIVGASIGLAICALVYPWYAWRLRHESPGPVIFRQERGGQNGRVFTMYKFRTMYPDAEARLQELQHRNEMRGTIFKMRDDPRVSPAGKMMRRFHLDELPQFWNVLVGDMSLVGARPCPMGEVNRYKWHELRRLSMKPGITGTWQVFGNHEISDFDEVVRLDCQYIDEWSLWKDCKILAKTLTKIPRADGW